MNDLLFLIDTIDHFGADDFTIDDLHDEMGLHPAILQEGITTLIAAGAIEEIDEDVYASVMDGYFDVADFLLEMAGNGPVVDTPPAPATHPVEDDLDKLLVEIGIPAFSEQEKAAIANESAFMAAQYEADVAAAMQGLVPQNTNYDW